MAWTIDSYKNFPDKISELDSLRFYSALIILINHLFFTHDMFFKWFNDHGTIGVDLFFVLSGFLITNLLLKEYAFNQTVSVRKFLMRRIVRLWPGFLVCSFVTTLLFLAIHLKHPHEMSLFKERVIYYYIHLSNYSIAYQGKLSTIFSILWSLAVEEHFYFFYPFLFLFIGRGKRLNLALLLLGAVIVASVFRFLNVGWYPETYEHINYFTSHTRIDGPAIGCLLALICYRKYKLNLFTEILLTLGSILSFWAIPTFLLSASSPYLLESRYLFISFPCALFVFLAINGDRFFRPILSNKYTVALGPLTYSVYLFHQAIYRVGFIVAEKFLSFSNPYILGPLFILTTFAFCFFYYHYFEKRINKLRSRFASLK